MVAAGEGANLRFRFPANLLAADIVDEHGLEGGEGELRGAFPEFASTYAVFSCKPEVEETGEADDRKESNDSTT